MSIKWLNKLYWNKPGQIALSFSNMNTCQHFPMIAIWTLFFFFYYFLIKAEIQSLQSPATGQRFHPKTRLIQWANTVLHSLHYGSVLSFTKHNTLHWCCTLHTSTHVYVCILHMSIHSALNACDSEGNESTWFYTTPLTPTVALEHQLSVGVS